MSDDFIPPNDDEFEAFQKKFTAGVLASSEPYGVTPEEQQMLQVEQTGWEKSLKDLRAAEDIVRAAHQGKNEHRASYVTVIRGVARKVNGSINITNEARVSLGLNPHAQTRTHIGVPETRPLGRVEAMGKHRLVLHWVDGMTPHTRKKPHGVHACQIWLKIGDTAPVDEKGCELVATDTATPYVYDFKPEDQGKIAYWMLRWVNPKGEPGPWGHVVSGVVPG